MAFRKPDEIAEAAIEAGMKKLSSRCRHCLCWGF